jgi:biotin carboxyl carrier protein
MSEHETFQSLVLDDTTYETHHTRKFASRKRWEAANPDEMRAFLPGVIQAVYATPGQRVRRGEPLLVLEAMKMRNDVVSPRDGVIEAVHVRLGEMVAKGQLMIQFG